MRKVIAQKIGTRVAWLRSFHRARMIIDAMERDGEIVRIAPEGGRMRNALILTQAGCDKYLGGVPAVDVTWPQPKVRK